jgi:hypothetical protein
VGAVTDWYGATVAWWAPFERDARRADGDLITIDLGIEQLIYRHVGLEVPGRLDPVPVRVEFYAKPPYDTYGLAPQDYPRVFADPKAASPHRMPDDALCLFFPGDPAHQRWTSQHGLQALFDLTRNHLFYELHWRATAEKVWLGPEAPHGFTRGRAA